MGCPRLDSEGDPRNSPESHRHNAYDSEKLEVEVSHYGIELIAPHRINRKNKPAASATSSADIGRLKDCFPHCKLPQLQRPESICGCSNAQSMHNKVGLIVFPLYLKELRFATRTM
jgi:hypothetical protein